MKHRTFLSKDLLITIKAKQVKQDIKAGNDELLPNITHNSQPFMRVHITDAKGNIIRKISGIAAII